MRFRPIQEEDLPLLNALVEEPLSLAQVRFYARTQHSFVAEDETPRGFALAQPFWMGDRAVVYIGRLEGKNEETLAGLLRAVVKSAMDAGASQVVFYLDPDQENLKALLLAQGFQVGPLVLAVRNL